MAKILIVDDERSIRNTLKDILEFEKYHNFSWQIKNMLKKKRDVLTSKYHFQSIFIDSAVTSLMRRDDLRYNRKTKAAAVAGRRTFLCKGGIHGGLKFTAHARPVV